MAKEVRFAPAPAPGSTEHAKPGSMPGPKRPDVARPDSRNLLERMKRQGITDEARAVLKENQ